jgi:hypothetical protein
VLSAKHEVKTNVNVLEIPLPPVATKTIHNKSMQNHAIHNQYFIHHIFRYMMTACFNTHITIKTNVIENYARLL